MPIDRRPGMPTDHTPHGNHNTVTHRLDQEQFDQLICALSSSPRIEQALTVILNSLHDLAATLQQVKDAVAGIDVTTETAIVKALETRATALENLGKPNAS